MAKFNIQVELDWFDEDSEANIDDELKAAIMSQIVSKTVDKLAANLQEEANELMTKKLEEFTLKIDEKLNSLLDDFFDTPRNITDPWGHIKKSNVTARQLLSEACDKFMTEIVDENGKPSAYSGKYTRIEHITKKCIDRDVTWAIEKAVKDAVDLVRKKVKETATRQLGEKMAEAVGLENIIFDK